MDLILLVLALVVTGIIAGLSSGMLGVGGCFIMVPVQYWLLTLQGIEPTIATRVAFCTGLAVTLPTVISGAWGHSRKNAVNWHAALPMGMGGIAGAAAGATLGSHLPGEILRLVFAVLVLLSAARMLWNVRECETCRFRQSLLLSVLIGCGIGILSGIGGIGGGIILVPILIFLLGYPVHRAIGTSAACMIFTSAAAVTTYLISGAGVSGLPPYSIGYLDLLQWITLTATTVPLSQVGVRFAHRCPAVVLRQIFAGVMVVIGILMIL